MKYNLIKFIKGMVKDEYPMIRDVYVSDFDEYRGYTVFLDIDFVELSKISYKGKAKIKDIIIMLGEYMDMRVGLVNMYSWHKLV